MLIGELCPAPVTHVALPRPVRVTSDVVLEVVEARKLSAAVEAPVRSFAGVCPQVSAEKKERLVADVADARLSLLAEMHSLVTVHLVEAGEHLATALADETV